MILGKEFKWIKPVALAFIILITEGNVIAQICEGSLGENIFTRGDFGTGLSNLITTDPQIAPGYTYTTNPPPQDGFYTITNNTGNWFGLFPTWLSIGDNSNDPNGYMMVVNASFSPGIFYEEIVDGLCPNTLYVFSADIINIVGSAVTGHILPNVEFLLDDLPQYSTGEIGQTQTWNTYGFTFTTGPDQTEVKLTLRNNAPGGIGNDLALDNISFRPCGPQSFIDLEVDKTIFLCEEGDPFAITADIEGDNGNFFSILWQRSLDEGVTWEEFGQRNDNRIIHDIFVPGTYRYRYLSATNDLNLENTKCRVISDEVIITVLPKTNEVVDTTCVAVPYLFGERALTEPGMYIDTFISTLNCDSIVFLDLRIINDPQIQFDVVARDPFCFEENTGRIEIQNITNGSPPFSISLDGIGGNFTFENLSSGNYEIRLDDKYGCNVIQEVTLTDPELFSIQLPPDQDLIFGDIFQINVQSNYDIISITWDPPLYLSCTDCQDPISLPSESIAYVSTALNFDGCRATDTIFIAVDRERIFYIPNIFSPNGDGNNDVFYISTYGSSVQLILKLHIFDRWGNLLYSADNISPNDLNLGWDPSTSVTEGVYSYYLEALLFDDSVEAIKGEVTLIR